MSGENWRRVKHERWTRREVASDFQIVTKNALFNGLQRRLHFLPETRDHVEGNLRIVNIFGQGLKRKQIHGLLMQFVHAALSALGSGFKDGGHDPANHPNFARTQSNKRENYGYGMRRHTRSRLKFGEHDLSALALAPY